MLHISGNCSPGTNGGGTALGLLDVSMAICHIGVNRRRGRVIAAAKVKDASLFAATAPATPWHALRWSTEEGIEDAAKSVGGVFSRNIYQRRGGVGSQGVG